MPPICQRAPKNKNERDLWVAEDLIDFVATPTATRFNWLDWLASCNSFNINFHLDMASEQGQVTVAVTFWCAFKTNNCKSLICNYSAFELIMVMCPHGRQTVLQVHPPICNGNCQLAWAMPPTTTTEKNGEHPQDDWGCDSVVNYTTRWTNCNEAWSWVFIVQLTPVTFKLQRKTHFIVFYLLTILF